MYCIYYESAALFLPENAHFRLQVIAGTEVMGEEPYEYEEDEIPYKE